MIKKLAMLVIAGALLVPVPAAQAETKVSDLSSVKGLSASQRAAVTSFVDGGRVSAAPATKSTASVSLAATGSRRASYYRGSFLMWTRDNVDFGFDWSRVTWTSAFQQAGSVFPNVARNKGITKYYDTASNDRFRAANTIGAGVVTPWGDVTVYTSDYIHRLSVYYNGAWSAWSD